MQLTFKEMERIQNPPFGAGNFHLIENVVGVLYTLQHTMQLLAVNCFPLKKLDPCFRIL
jgi:hypothetical protein